MKNIEKIEGLLGLVLAAGSILLLMWHIYDYSIELLNV
jgi:hypothetical protein